MRAIWRRRLRIRVGILEEATLHGGKPEGWWKRSKRQGWLQVSGREIGEGILGTFLQIFIVLDTNTCAIVHRKILSCVQVYIQWEILKPQAICLLIKAWVKRRLCDGDWQQRKKYPRVHKLGLLALLCIVREGVWRWIFEWAYLVWYRCFRPSGLCLARRH